MQEIHIVDIRKITEIIKTKYGYDFTNYAISSFKRRILRILELYKFNSVDALAKKISDDPTFFEEFISEITVNVTEMFRDPSFWRIIRDKILPNILLNHKKVSVWHAGCSSGEEVYSMAILLKEMGILESSKIIATDIDDQILERARSGVYTAKNMELNEKNYVRFRGENELNKYFSVKNGLAYMDKSLVKGVSYRKHDLVAGIVFNKFDIVFCRNVMIYFNQNLQNEVLKKLHESGFKYGYLAIGSKESLIWSEIANKYIVVNNEEKIYKKIKE
ncbi:MAG: protein-glutamate O-methyltransferase CheR [Cyclobacteriaceae bacterium]|nr:protein-glutamate O-methyltransferase CheR [Cyclobacteriaceae bacterium]MCK5471368.1 protein-glutamate O-methyltransferase CheR [Cyclobacteriaceae bacterium]MCK5700438.1 protein-glutamate O-methyltransferase CheR [Cyclobacteriaceae bacterium]